MRYLRFSISDYYVVRGDVVETMDVEGCRLVRGDNDFCVYKSPLKPLAEEMSLDPTIAMCWIF